MKRVFSESRRQVLEAMALPQSHGGEPPWHNAAKADEAVGEAYRAVQGLKGGIDEYDEVPKQLLPLYRVLGAASEALVKARNATTTARELAKKVKS